MLANNISDQLEGGADLSDKWYPLHRRIKISDSIISTKQKELEEQAICLRKIAARANGHKGYCF